MSDKPHLTIENLKGPPIEDVDPRALKLSLREAVRHQNE